MPSRKQARLAEIREFAASVAIVDEAGLAALRQRLRPIGEAGLRRLLRESGVPLAPVVEGVRQEDFDALERTLSALAAEYDAAADRDRQRLLRRLVITAKDHARFAARSARSETKRREKQEMAEWALVWLENPGVFSTWAKLRKATRERSSPL